MRISLILLIVGCAMVGLVLLVVGLFALLWLNAIRASWQRDRAIATQLAPVQEALDAGTEPPAEALERLAADRSTRRALLELLVEAEKPELFPDDYRDGEHRAEADLVLWLMHGNELGAPPDDISLIHVEGVADGERLGYVYLFRFRVNPPHWAADTGWMSGMAGPFWLDDPNQWTASDTFSELTSTGNLSPDEHLAFLRESIGRKGWVVRTG